MLKVVSTTGHRSCYDFDNLNQLGWVWESRSTMLPASLAACVPGIPLLRPHLLALASAGASFDAIACHGNQTVPSWFSRMSLSLYSGVASNGKSCLRFRSNCCCGQRIIARNHDCLDAHFSQFAAFFNATLYNVFQVE